MALAALKMKALVKKYWDVNGRFEQSAWTSKGYPEWMGKGPRSLMASIIRLVEKLFCFNVYAQTNSKSPDKTEIWPGRVLMLFALSMLSCRYGCKKIKAIFGHL